ncbi:Uncharacterised protein [Vibrio cholerae]|nr:Uncharacterised protein [Vibrio cholerae]
MIDEQRLALSTCRRRSRRHSVSQEPNTSELLGCKYRNRLCSSRTHIWNE